MTGTTSDANRPSGTIDWAVAVHWHDSIGSTAWTIACPVDGTNV